MLRLLGGLQRVHVSLPRAQGLHSPPRGLSRVPPPLQRGPLPFTISIPTINLSNIIHLDSHLRTWIRV
jgi:hypothetical protein